MGRGRCTVETQNVWETPKMVRSMRNELRRCIERLWARLRRWAATGQRRTGRLAWALVARAESGQSMVEYAILIAVVVVALLAVVQAFTGGLAQVFNNLLARIQGIGA
jgi:Flp pilus assembly pilin Flp